MDAARAGRIKVSLKTIHAASKQRVVKLTKQIKKALDVLLTEARIVGLDPTQIVKLCEVVCSSSVGSRIRNIAIKCLLPNGVVPAKAVLMCFSWMNTPEAPINIIRSLLSWLTAIFEIIDDVNSIAIAYSFLFFNLQNDALRKYVFPLLQLMTRKEDVVRYRVDQLMRLRPISGNDPYVNNMLALYKFHRPHLVSLRIGISKKNMPANVYQQWTSYIRDIQQRNQNGTFNIVLNSRNFWKKEDNMQVPEPAPSRKEKYSRNLPQLFDTESNEGKDKVSVHSISSYQELICVIDRIQLPHQTLIALRYPVIQNLVSCFQDKTFIIRFHSNLEHILYWDFKEEADTDDDKSDSLILKHIILFTQYFKEGTLIVEEFFAYFLKRHWNGYDFMDLFFTLISGFRLKSFESFREVLQLINKMYYIYNARNKAGVIHYLCELLENFINLDLKRRQKNFTSTVLKEIVSCLYFFENAQEDFLPYETITKLMDYVENLIVTGLIAEDNDTLILHAAASFYNLVVDFCLDESFYYLCLPSPAFIYGSFFTLDVTLVSHLCSILLKYREAYSKLKQKTQNFPTNLVSRLNNFIEDLMNSLWLQQAFETSRKNSIFKITDEAKDNFFNKGSIFSIYYHPAILPFAFTFNKTVSPLPFTNKSIQQAFKDDTPLQQYFKYLTYVGLESIPKFITVFAASK